MLVNHLQNKERIQKFKETADSQYISENELDEIACFQHDMAYGDFKDWSRRTDSDKILRGKAFNISKTPKYDGYQYGLASMLHEYFDKKILLVLVLKMRIFQTTELAEKLHKPIIKRFKKTKVH